VNTVANKVINTANIADTITGYSKASSERPISIYRGRTRNFSIIIYSEDIGKAAPTEWLESITPINETRYIESIT